MTLGFLLREDLHQHRASYVGAVVAVFYFYALALANKGAHVFERDVLAGRAVVQAAIRIFLQLMHDVGRLWRCSKGQFASQSTAFFAVPQHLSTKSGLKIH